MYCRLHYTSRPPRSARKSRKIWDALHAHHGIEPDEIGLYISEGGFRDWHIKIGCGTIEIEDAFVGTPSLVEPENVAAWPVTT